MSLADVVNEVEAAGAAFQLEGGKVRVSFSDDELRKELSGQIALLRENRGEVAAYLKGRNTIPPTARKSAPVLLRSLRTATLLRTPCGQKLVLC